VEVLDEDERTYKPIVPKWVADILEKQKKQDVFATLGHAKEWDDWKRKYSRKLKYARLNGWIVEGENEK
jgi:hypothetical protein